MRGCTSGSVDDARLDPPSGLGLDQGNEPGEERPAVPRVARGERDDHELGVRYVTRQRGIHVVGSISSTSLNRHRLVYGRGPDEDSSGGGRAGKGALSER